jgi:hypothetical protein
VFLRACFAERSLEKTEREHLPPCEWPPGHAPERHHSLQVLLPERTALLGREASSVASSAWMKRASVRSSSSTRRRTSSYGSVVIWAAT